MKVKQSLYRPGLAPESSRRLGLPDCKTISTRRWLGCQPYTPTAFTPRKYSWYLFLLEAELTPGSMCGWKDYVSKKFQWHHRESNPRPSSLQHKGENQLSQTMSLFTKLYSEQQCIIIYNRWNLFSRDTHGKTSLPTKPVSLNSHKFLFK